MTTSIPDAYLRQQLEARVGVRTVWRVSGSLSADTHGGTDMPDAPPERRGDNTLRIAVIAVVVIEAFAMVPLVLHLLNK